MWIGIIGAGFIGRAVARLGVAAGHEAMVSNSRGPGPLSSIPSGIGCRVGTVEEAAAFEVVMVAIPLAAYRTVPAEALAGKAVLDADSYYPERDGHIPELDAQEATTSGLLARHLPRPQVVKAFDAILVVDLEKAGQPVTLGKRRALPVAGGDPEAKAIAVGLLEQFGFDGVDAGTLAESWRFERAKPAYCVPLDRNGLLRALAAAERGVEVAEGSWRP